MKKYYPLILLFVSHIVMSQNYIYDVKSAERQQILKNDRSINIIHDVSMVVGSVFFSSTTDGHLEVTYSNDVSIKKIKLENTCKDTLYINMMCDMLWDDDEYCDFLDIRLPPMQECKLWVPRHTRYNLHFRNTALPQNNDLMIEVNTKRKKHITLSEKLIEEMCSLSQN